MISVKDFFCYELFNIADGDLEVSLSTLGASVIDIKFKKRSVILGYENAQGYLDGDSYIGATVGRYANRIGGAEFSLNGVKYKLSANEGKNQLHGGIEPLPYNKRRWTAEIIGGNSLRFKMISPDGDNGFPGNMEISVTYRVCGNCLRIDFEGVSDADTYFAPTNHTYFNLDGSGSVLSHKMRINADRYVEVDNEQAKQLEGIAQMTPQFYAQTLELGCCEPGEEARIIGFDFESDFVLTPFLEAQGISSLGERDLLIGSSMDSGILGDDYMILNTQLFALGQLEVTGTGLDKTLFMDIDTCRQLCLDNETLSQSWQKRNPYDYISVIMVRFEEGVDPDAFVQQVADSGIEIRAVLTSETISSLQNQLKVTKSLMLALWAACMVVAVMSLFGRFSALAKERRKEIGLLRALGLKKRQVFALVSGECCLLAAIGGVLGAAAALLSMNGVISLLEDAFMLSSSVWNTQLALICGVSGVVLAVLLGFFSALVPAARSAALDPQEAITQGEV